MSCVMVPDSRLTPDQCKQATIVIKSLLDFKPEDFGLPKYPVEWLITNDSYTFWAVK